MVAVSYNLRGDIFVFYAGGMLLARAEIGVPEAWPGDRPSLRGRSPKRRIWAEYRAEGADSGALRVVVELLERQAAGIEEVEHRLLDHLGETQEQRAVFLDRRFSGLDLRVVGLGQRPVSVL